jgi:hypothetical protein
MRVSEMTRRELLMMSVAAGVPLLGQAPEVHGLPPRAGAGEYSAQAKVGKFMMGADFTGHAVPTMEGPLTSEDYVVVEVAFFGDEKLVLSFEEFSLKIDKKKMPIQSRQFGMMMKSLSDPEWIPPSVEKESKGSIGAGGQAGAPKPEPPKMPFPLRRAMEQRALKSVLPEGERVLPVAGLVFFPYRGKDQNIETVELLYEGAAGKATLKLRG